MSSTTPDPAAPAAATDTAPRRRVPFWAQVFGGGDVAGAEVGEHRVAPQRRRARPGAGRRDGPG